MDKTAAPEAGSISKRIMSAFQTAGKATGAGFDFLLKTAMRESSLDADATPGTSSAKGYFQFIESTWLQMVHEEGSRFGLDQFASKISKTSKGSYQVSDPATKKAILDLRSDPEISSLLAGAFAQRNAEHLSERVGRVPTEGEVYLAHVFGAGGAEKIINLVENKPHTNAAQAFPAEAKANRALFYTSGERAKSIVEVYAQVTSGYSKEPLQLTPPSALNDMQNKSPEEFYNVHSPLGDSFKARFANSLFEGLYEPVPFAASPEMEKTTEKVASASLSAPPIPRARPQQLLKPTVGQPTDLSSYLRGGDGGMPRRDLAPPA